MRILHLNHFGSKAGGVEAYIADVSSALAKAGHASRLVSFAAENPSQLMPGTVQVIAPQTGDLLAGIKETIADFRPDVAYVHAVYQPWLVKWLAQRLPVLAYVHGPYLVCPGSGQYLRRSMQICSRRSSLGCLMNAQTERCCFGRNPARHIEMLRRVYRFIETYRGLPVLVGSEYMRDLLIRSDIPVGNIGLLPPILLTDQLPSPIGHARSRAILYAGRLVPEKGLNILTQALARVHGEWQLMIAGDGPERPQLEETVRLWGLADKAQFLGWRTESEMSDLYRQCAFVAVPSLWPEPFGRVGPEAARYGRAAVAFDVGGVRAWLDDGVTGHLAPPGNVDALVANLQRLLDDPEHCRRLGEQAFAIAGQRWKETDHVHRLTEYLAQAIAEWGQNHEQRA